MCFKFFFKIKARKCKRLYQIPTPIDIYVSLKNNSDKQYLYIKTTLSVRHRCLPPNYLSFQAVQEVGLANPVFLHL